MSLSSGGVPKYTPPKCYGKARGGIFRIMSQRLLWQKGLDSPSPKGEDSPVSLPCLGARWRTTRSKSYLDSQYGFMVALHDPLPVPHCHPSSATIGCTCAVAGVGFSPVQNIMDYKPSTLFTQLRHVAGSFTAHRLVCRVFCACAHGCTWVPPILTYLGKLIFQIPSPSVHCHCNNYGALMLLHP